MISYVSCTTLKPQGYVEKQLTHFSPQYEQSHLQASSSILVLVP